MFGEPGRSLALLPAPAVDHQDLVIVLGADGKITDDWREGFGLAANGFVLKVELHLCTGLQRRACGRRALGWRCPLRQRQARGRGDRSRKKGSKNDYAFHCQVSFGFPPSSTERSSPERVRLGA